MRPRFAIGSLVSLAACTIAGCGPKPADLGAPPGDWSALAVAIGDAAAVEGDGDGAVRLVSGERWLALRPRSPVARGPAGTLALPHAPRAGPDGLWVSPQTLERLLAWARLPRPEPAAVDRRVLRIVIDAGHGGTDPGAIGPGGTQERDVNLDIALRLGRILQSRGHEAFQTRPDDRALHPDKRDDLNARAMLSLHKGAHALVSIHADASEDPTRHGAWTFYPSAEDKGTGRPVREAREGPLADVLARADPRARGVLQAALSDEFVRAGIGLAGAVQSAMIRATGAQDLGIRRHPDKRLRVISETPVPAILVEVGHLSCAGEEARLADGAHRQRIAEGIADGIEAFFERGH
ncbi:MAG: N-acetylmuramoyl-L-alanine amidase [Planctomycetes bacterium]|nr:N-acetylmuramoyl-L-alanine amidase [Planctomycetota bacterium]